MYKAKLWDEDKWDIHSKSYSSSKYSSSISAEDKKEDKKYHEQKYGQKEENSGSDYMRKDDKKKEDKEKNPSPFDELVEEGKKEDWQKTENEEIPLRAAKQIFSEAKFEAGKQEQKKDEKTIDDAIKKAIEDEKRVIIMDS